jgi:hypothetical protein
LKVEMRDAEGGGKTGYKVHEILRVESTVVTIEATMRRGGDVGRWKQRGDEQGRTLPYVLLEKGLEKADEEGVMTTEERVRTVLL